MPIDHGPGGLSIVGEQYESKEFTLANGSTDYNVKTQQTMFAKFKHAHHVTIRTDEEITVKFNKTTEQAITVEAGSRLVTDGILVTNIFLTAAIGDANVKILMS